MVRGRHLRAPRRVSAVHELDGFVTIVLIRNQLERVGVVAEHDTLVVPVRAAWQLPLGALHAGLAFAGGGRGLRQRRESHHQDGGHDLHLLIVDVQHAVFKRGRGRRTAHQA